jgi:hypothetical protein
VLDLWRRARAPQEEFFIPDDFEISQEELASVCARARAWRGITGSTRKVAVSTYIEEDRDDPHFREITKHIVVYEVDPDGGKTLFRHFLLQPSGAILEIFEQFKVVLSAQYYQGAASAAPYLGLYLCPFSSPIQAPSLAPT